MGIFKHMSKLAAAVLCLLSLLSFAGCGKLPKEEKKPESFEKTQGPESTPAVMHLICSAESEEQAREIAQDYGVCFISYASGVAVFETSESLDVVAARGKGKNLPDLEIDREMQAFSAS